MKNIYKKNNWNIYMTGGLILVVSALLLVGYNIYDESRAKTSVENTLQEIELKNIEPVSVALKTNSLGEYDLNSVGPEEEIPDYLLNPRMGMPEVNIMGKDYVGVIELPTLEKKLPVMNDWDYDKLKLAPCTYSGSAYLDNLIILAHNYKSHFGGLNRMKTGDKVLFRDMEGNEFNYKVVEKEVLAASAVENMKSGDWDLTLFTCTLGGKSRMALRCEKEQPGFNNEMVMPN